MGAAAAESHRPIALRYRQRSPYIEKKWGKLSGTCGDVAVAAFKKAKIEVTEVETPFFRQIAQFESGEQICSIAWLKTVKREQTLKFSEPICEDGPWIVVGHKGSVKPTTPSAEDLLKDSSLKVLRRSQFSFGEVLDSLIEKYKTPLISVENSDLKQIFDIILAGRADYTFLPAREFEHLVEKLQLPEKEFVVLRPDDLKGPHYRYLMCTMSVPDAVIKKFNKAISSAN
ncbi:substrate-binding periplasmic protein [Bdellovibrio sp. GT3]|uniref:substrate-binding periplasmic protein n=1 Tax=Bdellovibrio sp. GT3 TaxID=3136282 RepID=UPI0030F0B4EE